MILLYAVGYVILYNRVHIFELLTVKDKGQGDRRKIE